MTWATHGSQLLTVICTRYSPGDIPPPEITPPPRENPPEVTPMGQLWSGPRLVGRIVSAVRVIASFQIFALRMLLH